jgi:hypothetical protein
MLAVIQAEQGEGKVTLPPKFMCRSLGAIREQRLSQELRFTPLSIEVKLFLNISK